MVGRSKDPKGIRITVRISNEDLLTLQAEANRRGVTVSVVVRDLIRQSLEAKPAT
jgi:predicted DNA binding CopG/RHH family protein